MARQREAGLSLQVVSRPPIERFMRALALLDYDNIRLHGSFVQGIHGSETEANDIVDRLSNAFRAAFPQLTELDLRFYGGWTDESGSRSPAASQLVSALRFLRARKNGVMIRPTLATTMISFPQLLLRGTIRLQGKQRRQKMVDGMLGCDAAFLASGGQRPVGVVTDDEDLIPALLLSHAANPNGTVWFRCRRAVGTGLNDQSLQRQGIRICCIEKPTQE